MIASLSLLSIKAPILAEDIAQMAFAKVVEYRWISLIGLPVKSLNGVNGKGFSIGFKMAEESVSNFDSQSAWAGSENSLVIEQEKVDWIVGISRCHSDLIDEDS